MTDSEKIKELEKRLNYYEKYKASYQLSIRSGGKLILIFELLEQMRIDILASKPSEDEIDFMGGFLEYIGRFANDLDSLVSQKVFGEVDKLSLKMGFANYEDFCDSSVQCMTEITYYQQREDLEEKFINIIEFFKEYWKIHSKRNEIK